MKKLLVGMGSCGLAAGARQVYDVLQSLVEVNSAACTLTMTGCIGMCFREPLVEVRDGLSRFIYGGVTPGRAQEIFNSHILGNDILTEHVVYSCQSDGTIGGSDADFLSWQKRIVLRNCGTINPESIADYEQAGGYGALRKVLFDMKPDEVIQEIKNSGLRGRGGAGFPTGQKWALSAAAAGDVKYVVCNADEGDPGAFMDRSVLESDPHAMLEGMIVAGRAIGAHSGYIYCRAEYPLAIRRLAIAISAAREKGYLGKKVMGADFDFDIHIKQGAGAFVCGEETALFASIEGERGMPRLRPPFPAEKGLWQKPTNNNNVETYANVPWIILNGAAAFSAFGTEKSRGTKVFALAGKVARGGLAEVPMGMPINDLILKIGGGIKEGKKFKAVQMGGPSGGCIPSSLGDTPVDFENIPATGAIMGSGGMVVLDDSTCMVEMARFFLEFTQNESCGKCTMCRIGTLRMLETLVRITQGEAKSEDLDKLQQLALQVKEASLCGLGQTAPNPVLTTLRYFRDEYNSHIIDRKCPSHSCTALVDFCIDPAKCTGCRLCVKICPVKAISGEPKKPHSIDKASCAKCGKCISVCNETAIYKS